MKSIKLTRGLFAIVDDSDYDTINSFKWCAVKRRNTYYAARKKKGKTILLHRFIMNAKEGKVVDHIDGNGLNCQRSNMRICSIKENNWNSGPQRSNKTGYKGVFRRKNGRYVASIFSNGRRRNLGTYDDPVEAAKAYDREAKKYQKEFCRLNFPES